MSTRLEQSGYKTWESWFGPSANKLFGKEVGGDDIHCFGLDDVGQFQQIVCHRIDSLGFFDGAVGVGVVHTQDGECELSQQSGIRLEVLRLRMADYWLSDDAGDLVVLGRRVASAGCEGGPRWVDIGLGDCDCHNGDASGKRGNDR